MEEPKPLLTRFGIHHRLDTLSDMVDIHGNLGFGPCENGLPCRIKQMSETFRIGTHSCKKEGVGYEIHSKKSHVPVLTLLH